MLRNSVLNTRLRTTLAATCLLAASLLHASPLPHLPHFEAVGNGTMRFFGLRIYDATLWSAGGVWSASQPYALELVYARSFDGGAIAQRSIEEMRAQRPWPEATLARWEKDMRALFPNVDKGDRLIGVRMPGAGAMFYYGTRKLGQINDEAFAEAFFGIWLNPATRAPDLRAQLLKSP
ncbi:MAG: chalcone isomerase family protein [Thiobacillus sp.]|nr:chalcone isomerase family protein [Thiobacillus sp.]